MLGNNAMSSGNAQAGLTMAGGAADASKWQGYNNAAQGSIANYLTYQGLQPSGGGGGGGQSPWTNNTLNGYTSTTAGR
jgi:hypothetical protein